MKSQHNDIVAGRIVVDEGVTVAGGIDVDEGDTVAGGIVVVRVLQ